MGGKKSLCAMSLSGRNLDLRGYPKFFNPTTKENAHYVYTYQIRL